MKGNDYFNSGMMLIDVGRYVAANIGHKALALAAAKAFPYMDQDVLNIVLEGKTYFTTSLAYNCKVFTRDERFEQEKDEVKIIHYTGKNKPWKFYTTFWHGGYHVRGERCSWIYPYYALWREYAAQSPWKNVPYVMPTYKDWRYLSKMYYNNGEYTNAVSAYWQYLRKKFFEYAGSKRGDGRTR